LLPAEVVILVGVDGSGGAVQLVRLSVLDVVRHLPVLDRTCRRAHVIEGRRTAAVLRVADLEGDARRDRADVVRGLRRGGLQDPGGGPAERAGQPGLEPTQLGIFSRRRNDEAVDGSLPVEREVFVEALGRCCRWVFARPM
jgi:hypothetical protein